MSLTYRFSPLEGRHRALGSTVEPWNGMPTAWTYDADLADGYKAVRQKAGLMDVSGLNVVHVVGPHSHLVLNRAITRDTRTIYPGKASYTTMLDDRGMLVDDGIVYRTGPNSFMVVHGSGRTLEQINKEAVGRDVVVLFDNDMQVLSLQGPLAVEYLSRHIPDIGQLKYFHHRHAVLFGASILLSRTGYTGERGYEIYCQGQDAPKIWDTILEEGADMGIIPVQFEALDLFRVEAALPFFPDDNSETHPFEDDLPGDTLWEMGLDFTVSATNEEFRGRAQHLFRKGKERFRFYGVELEESVAAEAGSEIQDNNGKKIGVITAGMVSPITQRSLALCRIDPKFAESGLEVKVVTGGQTITATTHSLPFEDPGKEKRVSK